MFTHSEKDQTVLFQTIRLAFSHLFARSSKVKQFFLTLDRPLSGATTPRKSEPGSEGNEGVLCIPQSSSITGTPPSDCLVSYLGPSLRKSYSVEMLSVSSTTPAYQAGFMSERRYRIVIYELAIIRNVQYFKVIEAYCMVVYIYIYIYNKEENTICEKCRAV